MPPFYAGHDLILVATNLLSHTISTSKALALSPKFTSQSFPEKRAYQHVISEEDLLHGVNKFQEISMAIELRRFSL